MMMDLMVQRNGSVFFRLSLALCLKVERFSLFQRDEGMDQLTGFEHMLSDEVEFYLDL